MQRNAEPSRSAPSSAAAGSPVMTEEHTDEHLGLWEDPVDPCPICMKRITVSEQERATIPCSVPGCSRNYHTYCVGRTQFKFRILRNRDVKMDKCPACFVDSITKSLTTDRNAVIALERRKKIPETSYEMKRRVVEMCGLVEPRSAIGAMFSRVASDSEDVIQRVNLMYEGIDGKSLYEHHVTYANLTAAGYTMPMMSRDFKLRPPNLIQLKFTSSIDLPAAIEHPAVFCEDVGMTPAMFRRVELDVKKLKASNPTATQLLALGLHIGELLFMGLNKNDLGNFTKISQQDWTKRLGLSPKVFEILNIKPTDFGTNRDKPMHRFDRLALIEEFGLKNNPAECVRLGLLTTESPSTSGRQSPPRGDGKFVWLIEK